MTITKLSVNKFIKNLIAKKAKTKKYKTKKAVGMLIAFSLIISNISVFADATGTDLAVVNIENTDNTVTVSGISASGQKDTDISVVATKADVERENVTAENAADTVVYADQLKTEEGGTFSYNFKLDEEYGTYNIYVYDSFDGGYTKKTVVYQKPQIIRPYGIEVIFEDSDGNTIYYLTSDIQSVNVKVNIAEDNEICLKDNQNVTFIAAVYKNERLTYAETITAGVGVCETEINANGADVVKVFGWSDTTEMTPFMTEASVMQYDKLMPKQTVFDGKNDIGSVTGMEKLEDSETDFRVANGKTGEIVLENSTDNTPVDAAVISFDFMTESEDTSAYFRFISKKNDGTERTTNNLILRNRRTDVDGEVIDPVMQVFKYDQSNTLDDTNVYGSKTDYYSDYIYRDYGVDLLESDTEISDKDASKSSYKQLLHKKITITPQTWHHVDICVDYSYGAENGYGSDGTYGRGFVWYYLDGKLLKQAEYWDYYNSPGDMRYSQNPSWAVQDIRPGLKKLKSVKVVNRGTGGDLDLKNVEVREIKNYGESMNFENGLEYPVYFDKWLSLKNKSIGSSFVGKNINYSAEITNPYLKDGVFSYSLEVINADTNIIEQTVKDAFNLAAGETKTVPIAFTAQKYGFYKIKGTATENLTGRIINIEADFTVSVKNREHNPKMMFCDHMTVHYMGTRDAEARLKYLSDIGISGIREDQPYLKSNGDLHDGAKLVFDETKKNNMKRVVILNGGLWDSAISTPAELETFKSNIVQEIKATAGYDVDYEIYNEYNLHETNPDYTAEAYLEILKAAYTAVKQYNPKAKIYGLGSATNMWKGNVSRESYFEFTDRCLKLGAAHYLDGFALHPYGGGYTSATENYDKLITPIINMYKNTQCECSECTAAGENTYDIDEKDVIITEYGYSSEDDKYRTAILTEFLNLVGDEVDVISLYVDVMKETTSTDQKNYGMIASNHIQFNYPKEPYRAQASIIAVAAFNDLTNGAYNKKIYSLKNDSDLKLVKSEFENGETLLALFDSKLNSDGSSANRGEKIKIRFTDIDDDGLKLYDVYGNAAEISVSADGTAEVEAELSMMPKYIKGSFEFSVVE